MNNAYILKHTSDISQMLEGRIEVYPWGGSYRPLTRFYAGWTDDAIHVHMCCEEKNPLRRVTEPNGNVWCDSCMEFFFAPGKYAQDGYFNFEMNANGALLLGWGTSDTEFVFSDFPRQKITIVPTVEDDRWLLDLTVPFELIRYHYPAFEPRVGLIAHGNFYKCGDETAFPHFGCHFPIDANAITEPCFHRPEYYGEIIFGE